MSESKKLDPVPPPPMPPLLPPPLPPLILLQSSSDQNKISTFTNLTSVMNEGSSARIPDTQQNVQMLVNPTVYPTYNYTDQLHQELPKQIPFLESSPNQKLISCQTVVYRTRGYFRSPRQHYRSSLANHPSAPRVQCHVAGVSRSPRQPFCSSVQNHPSAPRTHYYTSGFNAVQYTTYSNVEFNHSTEHASSDLDSCAFQSLITGNRMTAEKTPEKTGACQSSSSLRSSANQIVVTLPNQDLNQVEMVREQLSIKNDQLDPSSCSVTNDTKADSGKNRLGLFEQYCNMNMEKVSQGLDNNCQSQNQTTVQFVSKTSKLSDKTKERTASKISGQKVSDTSQDPTRGKNFDKLFIYKAISAIQKQIAALSSDILANKSKEKSQISTTKESSGSHNHKGNQYCWKKEKTNLSTEVTQKSDKPTRSLEINEKVSHTLSMSKIAKKRSQPLELSEIKEKHSRTSKLSEITEKHSQHSSLSEITEKHSQHSSLSEITKMHSQPIRMSEITEQHSQNTRLSEITAMHRQPIKLSEITERHSQHSSLSEITERHSQHSSLSEITKMHSQHPSFSKITEKHSEHSRLLEITEKHSKHSKLSEIMEKHSQHSRLSENTEKRSRSSRSGCKISGHHKCMTLERAQNQKLKKEKKSYKSVHSNAVLKLSTAFQQIGLQEENNDCHTKNRNKQKSKQKTISHKQQNKESSLKQNKQQIHMAYVKSCLSGKLYRKSDSICDKPKVIPRTLDTTMKTQQGSASQIISPRVPNYTENHKSLCNVFKLDRTSGTGHLNGQNDKVHDNANSIKTIDRQAIEWMKNLPVIHNVSVSEDVPLPLCSKKRSLDESSAQENLVKKMKVETVKQKRDKVSPPAVSDDSTVVLSEVNAECPRNNIPSNSTFYRDHTYSLRPTAKIHEDNRVPCTNELSDGSEMENAETKSPSISVKSAPCKATQTILDFGLQHKDLNTNSRALDSALHDPWVKLKSLSTLCEYTREILLPSDSLPVSQVEGDSLTIDQKKNIDSEYNVSDGEPDETLVDKTVERNAEITEKQDAEIAERSHAEIAKKRDAEIAEISYAEIVRKISAEIAKKRDAEIAEKRDAEIAERSYAEIVKKISAEIAKKRDTEIAERSCAEIRETSHAEIGEKSHAEIAKKCNTETAEKSDADIKEKCHAEIEKRDAKIAEKKFAEIAEKNDAEIVEKSYAELAKKSYAQIAKRSHAEMTEKNDAEIVEKSYAELEKKSHAEIVEKSHADIAEKRDAEIVETHIRSDVLDQIANDVLRGTSELLGSVVESSDLKSIVESPISNFKGSITDSSVTDKNKTESPAGHSENDSFINHTDISTSESFVSDTKTVNDSSVIEIDRTCGQSHDFHLRDERNSLDSRTNKREAGLPTLQMENTSLNQASECVSESPGVCFKSFTDSPNNDTSESVMDLPPVLQIESTCVSDSPQMESIKDTPQMESTNDSLQMESTNDSLITGSINDSLVNHSTEASAFEAPVCHKSSVSKLPLNYTESSAVKSTPDQMIVIAKSPLISNDTHTAFSPFVHTKINDIESPADNTENVCESRVRFAENSIADTTECLLDYDKPPESGNKYGFVECVQYHPISLPLGCYKYDEDDAEENKSLVNKDSDDESILEKRMAKMGQDIYNTNVDKSTNLMHWIVEKLDDIPKPMCRKEALEETETNVNKPQKNDTVRCSAIRKLDFGMPTIHLDAQDKKDENNNTDDVVVFHNKCPEFFRGSKSCGAKKTLNASKVTKTDGHDITYKKKEEGNSLNCVVSDLLKACISKVQRDLKHNIAELEESFKCCCDSDKNADLTEDFYGMRDALLEVSNLNVGQKPKRQKLLPTSLQKSICSKKKGSENDEFSDEKYFQFPDRVASPLLLNFQGRQFTKRNQIPDEVIDVDESRSKDTSNHEDVHEVSKESIEFENCYSKNTEESQRIPVLQATENATMFNSIAMFSCTQKSGKEVYQEKHSQDQGCKINSDKSILRSDYCKSGIGKGDFKSMCHSGMTPCHEQEVDDMKCSEKKERIGKKFNQEKLEISKTSHSESVENKDKESMGTKSVDISKNLKNCDTEDTICLGKSVESTLGTLNEPNIIGRIDITCMEQSKSKSSQAPKISESCTMDKSIPTTEQDKEIITRSKSKSKNKLKGTKLKELKPKSVKDMNVNGGHSENKINCRRGQEYKKCKTLPKSKTGVKNEIKSEFTESTLKETENLDCILKDKNVQKRNKENKKSQSETKSSSSGKQRKENVEQPKSTEKKIMDNCVEDAILKQQELENKEDVITKISWAEKGMGIQKIMGCVEDILPDIRRSARLRLKYTPVMSQREGYNRKKNVAYLGYKIDKRSISDLKSSVKERLVSNEKEHVSNLDKQSMTSVLNVNIPEAASVCDLAITKNKKQKGQSESKKTILKKRTKSCRSKQGKMLNDTSCETEVIKLNDNQRDDRESPYKTEMADDNGPCESDTGRDVKEKTCFILNVPPISSVHKQNVESDKEDCTKETSEICKFENFEESNNDFHMLSSTRRNSNLQTIKKMHQHDQYVKRKGGLKTPMSKSVIKCLPTYKKCQLLKSKFRLVTNREEQKVSRSSRRRQCGFCGSYFPWDKLQRHILDMHPLRCSQCMMLFDSKETKAEHHKDFHVNELHHCITCRRTYSSIRLYHNHCRTKLHHQNLQIQNGVVQVLRNIMINCFQKAGGENPQKNIPELCNAMMDKQEVFIGPQSRSSAGNSSNTEFKEVEMHKISNLNTRKAVSCGQPLNSDRSLPSTTDSSKQSVLRKQAVNAGMEMNCQINLKDINKNLDLLSSLKDNPEVLEQLQNFEMTDRKGRSIKNFYYNDSGVKRLGIELERKIQALCRRFTNVEYVDLVSYVSNFSVSDLPPRNCPMLPLDSASQSQAVSLSHQSFNESCVDLPPVASSEDGWLTRAVQVVQDRSLNFDPPHENIISSCQQETDGDSSFNVNLGEFTGNPISQNSDNSDQSFSSNPELPFEIETDNGSSEPVITELTNVRGDSNIQNNMLTFYNTEFQKTVTSNSTTNSTSKSYHSCDILTPVNDSETDDSLNSQVSNLASCSGSEAESGQSNSHLRQSTATSISDSESLPSGSFDDVITVTKDSELSPLVDQPIAENTMGNSHTSCEIINVGNATSTCRDKCLSEACEGSSSLLARENTLNGQGISLSPMKSPNDTVLRSDYGFSNLPSDTSMIMDSMTSPSHCQLNVRSDGQDVEQEWSDILESIQNDVLTSELYSSDLQL